MNKITPINNKIGIRMEDYSSDESRVPLTPSTISELINKHKLNIVVEKSRKENGTEVRCFTDNQFKKYNIPIVDNLQDCDIILGIKPVPVEKLYENKIYLFFSHTTKAQEYTSEMLAKIIDRKITLIDYELIQNEKHKRTVFFGDYAGIVGTVESLRMIGEKMKKLGQDNIFTTLQPTYKYEDHKALTEALQTIGKTIKQEGYLKKSQIKNKKPEKQLSPFVIAVTGNGNVAKAAISTLKHLPLQFIAPQKFNEFLKTKHSSKKIYVVHFQTKDLYRKKTSTTATATATQSLEASSFDPDEYKKQGKKNYDSILRDYLPNLTLLINCIFWDHKYPKLIEKKDIQTLSLLPNSKFLGIGDISCDIQGSIEITQESTQLKKPFLTYLPEDEKAHPGILKKGISIMAIDILPTGLPKDASHSFSQKLQPYILALAKTDFSKKIHELKIETILKNATICHQGNLTEQYKYLKEN